MHDGFQGAPLILDSGYSTTVCEQQWFEEYESSLTSYDQSFIEEKEASYTSFTFGMETPSSL